MRLLGLPVSEMFLTLEVRESRVHPISPSA